MAYHRAGLGKPLFTIFRTMVEDTEFRQSQLVTWTLREDRDKFLSSFTKTAFTGMRSRRLQPRIALSTGVSESRHSLLEVAGIDRESQLRADVGCDYEITPRFG